MANAIDLNTRTYRSGTNGNAAYEEFKFAIAATELIGATSDLVRMPAGTRIFDWVINVLAQSNATVTANVGLKSVAGTNQDSANYLFATVALSAAAFTRKTNANGSIVLAQEMYLRMTIAGANLSQVCSGYIGIHFDYLGTL